MMKNKIMQIFSKLFSVLFVIALVISLLPVNVVYSADDTIDPVIVVSLGDSYSSGEGIEKFYGQEKDVADKVKDKDWVAHRSRRSWPGQLVIPGVEGTMSEYKEGEKTGHSNCEWYFVAASGAKTENFNESQEVIVRQKDFAGGIKYPVLLNPQLDVFSGINGTVDYVTLTIGGNDVGFGDIVATCVTESSYLANVVFDNTKLENKINTAWKNMDKYKADIKQAYIDIHDKASDADIIVAGYPKLFEKEGKGAAISREEAEHVNENVTRFNREVLMELVDECDDEMKIHFVDVETVFDTHEAYSKEPWINRIDLLPKDQDVNYKKFGSAYSVHPNATGAAKYAECVNRKIQDIEEEKGIVSGKVCKAADRVTAIQGAEIAAYSNGNLVSSWTADSTGNYSVKLPVGDYKMVISAEGYLPFTAYATVTKDTNIYMETFLMIQGSESETGVAEGVISSALTGRGIEGVSLEIREGWNNTNTGEVLLNTTTDVNGDYSVTLPLGNYTVIATKEGYISNTANIIVQEGTTSSQNASMSPIISGDSFRIVLTWGENPRDLDSHVEGSLSDGSSFHVYYSNKSVYDGEVEVCNLDVDDTSSYGPETITLNTTSGDPYYYYIYRYAGSGTVSTSEAQINIYQGENLIGTFNVPTDQGDGDYWNVFAIVNGKLVMKNTVTSSADTSYASPNTIATFNLEEEELMPPKDQEIQDEELIVEETEQNEVEENLWDSDTGEFQ